MRPYLPSTQFALLIFSLFASAGLVYGAQIITRPPTSVVTSTSPSDAAAAAAEADWQNKLASIQDQSGVSLPQAPDPTTVGALLQAAQSSNVTDSVGRSLLVNLTNAKAQGLGDDAPTQNQLIAQAQAQMNHANTKTYTLSDLTIVADSAQSQHEYGNALMRATAAHPQATVQGTISIIASVTDTQNQETLAKLKPVEADYRALTQDLLKLPVPKTFSPFHLAIVNDFAKMSDTYPDMEEMIADPLRGLAGLQNYNTLAGESGRMFINIAQALNKDGILFTSGESGASWAVLLSESQQ